MIPCKKSKKKITKFFLEFWLEKSKILVILGIQITFFDFFLVIFELFIDFFFRKSQILLICKSEIFKQCFIIFSILKSVIIVIRGKKYSKYSYFMALKGKLAYNFPKHFFVLFHYFSHHGRSTFFFALLLLSIQYLNLTI